MESLFINDLLHFILIFHNFCQESHIKWQFLMITVNHIFKIWSQSLFISFLKFVHSVISFLEISFHPSVILWPLFQQIFTHRNAHKFWHHITFQPANQGCFARHIVNLSMIDKKSIQMITEWHRRVKCLTDGFLGALVYWQRLETKWIESASDPKILIINKFLLNPA